MSNCKTLKSSIQGCVDMPLIQGDSQDFNFEFQPPFDLAEYDITMDIKTERNVNFRPVIRKKVGDGIVVSGQTMTVQFGDEFFASHREHFTYDIAFQHKVSKAVMHLLTGKIIIKLSTTKP